MKKSLSIVAIALGVALCARGAEAPAPSAAAAFPLDKLLATVREQSVFRKKIDWPQAEADLRAGMARASSDEEVANAVVALFAKMNDVHSMLEWKGRSYANYEGLADAARAKVRPLLDREQAQTGKIVATMIEDRVAYVLVPAMPAYTADDIRSFSRALYGRVSDLMARKPLGWIVDLRLDGGGNLYPMLLGLSPLLGDGVVGGTIDADGREVQKWVLKEGGLYWRDGAGDRAFAELGQPARVSDPKASVVVLLGPTTRSSGQATALAFRGRPNCVMIGEPTAKGTTTVTNPFPLGRDATLSLAVGFMADRNGAACESQVLPDKTVVGGDFFDSLKEDSKVLAALAWLER